MITGKCNVCDGKLIHHEKSVVAKCTECGTKERTKIICSEGHYLCNACASKESINKIFRSILDFEDENPFDLAEKLIVKCGICGNSPHPLTAAAFLMAYKNFTHKIDDDDVIEGVMRASQIPGGWCGYYGTCGAAVGMGVAFSIITKATPMSDGERSISNLITSKSLTEVANLGGPRCCTSSVRVSIESGISLLEEHLNIKFPKPKTKFTKCWVSKYNDECKNNRCKYFMVKGSN